MGAERGPLLLDHRRAARAGPGRDPLRCPRGGQPPGAPRASGSGPPSGGGWRRRALLVPWSEGGLAEAPQPRADAVVVPVPVAPSGAPAAERDIAAITYGANPEKKGLDRVLTAGRSRARPDEELVVAGVEGAAAEGVRFTGMLPRAEYRALLRRARVFVCAPRREDYGIAQLEALADGCVLVTTPSPGPYAALPVARGARRAPRVRPPLRRAPARPRRPCARLRGARPRGARPVAARGRRPGGGRAAAPAVQSLA